MRNILILSLSGVALAALAAPALAQDITIAVAGPMTGPVASIGDQMKRGAEAAAQAINDAGGVDGKKDQDRRRGRRLRSETGGCGRQPDRRPADQVRRRPRLLRLVDSGRRHLRREQRPDDEPGFVESGADRKGPSDRPAPLRPRRRAGRLHRAFIADKYKGKKIAILHDKSAYGKGVATVVKDKLNADGVKEVMFEGINPGEKDYSAIVTKLKDAGADVVYFGGYHPEAGLIVRQAADQGYKPQLIAPDSLATSEFWQISGPAGEGVLFTFPTDPRRSPAAAHALEQFKAQGFNPEGFTLFSYGVVQAIADGIKKADSDDPKAVAKALEDGQPVDTVMGPVKFDAKGDIKDPRYDINVWKEGKYAPIAQ